MELKATVLNINPGMNTELLYRCKTLIYVERVREHSKYMPTEEAVELAVKECIQEGV